MRFTRSRYSGPSAFSSASRSPALSPSAKAHVSSMLKMMLPGFRVLAVLPHGEDPHVGAVLGHERGQHAGKASFRPFLHLAGLVAHRRKGVVPGGTPSG